MYIFTYEEQGVIILAYEHYLEIHAFSIDLLGISKISIVESYYIATRNNFFTSELAKRSGNITNRIANDSQYPPLVLRRTVML